MKQDRQDLVDRIRAALATSADIESALRAAAESIDGYSDGYNWTGFYLMKGDYLEVGPYVGPVTEHTRIELNQGICGAAANQKRTVNIEDVRSDPRFLACSISTRSEIVVPLLDGDKCLGEIDIDSNQSAFFGDEDREMLEAIAALVVTRLKELAVN